MVEIISVAKNFGVRPSSLLSDLSGYDSFCFDVACSIYVTYMSDGKYPLGIEPPEKKNTGKPGKSYKETGLDMSKVL